MLQMILLGGQKKIPLCLIKRKNLPMNNYAKNLVKNTKSFTYAKNDYKNSSLSESRL